MQQAEQPASNSAKPPQPAPDWTWSDRLGRWIAPGASPRSGIAPPLAERFFKGDPRARELGKQAGLVSGRTRALIADDDRLLDRIARRWLRSCEKGDNRALAMLLDRLEGPVEQRIDATVTSRYVIEEAGTAYVDIPAEANESAPLVTGREDGFGE